MRIGIDLGGTKIEGIALDIDGSEAARLRIDTPAGSYGGTVSAIADLVLKLEDMAGTDPGTCSVGIGIPGSVSPATTLVKNANSTCLIGQPLGEDLKHALGRPVRLANDANCFAVSEATDGAGAGHANVFGVILGTGVGGGIAINARPLEGLNAIAGEWGHNPLPWPDDNERPGPPCYCGKQGCIETFLSGPGLSYDYHLRSGEHRSAIDIASLNTPMAHASLKSYEARLAKALASVINILDPDAIILGGGLSQIDRLYENVPKLWDTWVFSDHCTTQLLRNKHGDSSGVRGAAWLWPQP